MATLPSPRRSPVADIAEHAFDIHNTPVAGSELHGRPSSIDMALRLEHELDAEHEEESGHSDPDGDRALESVNLDSDGPSLNANSGSEALAGANKPSRPVSLDPLVLAGIVANLRADLARTTQERDALTDALQNTPSREAELREALALLTEKCQELEGEVTRLRRKSQDDEDAIHMLRTKVEESRRGLMRLQTESKRMSQMSIDTGRANSFLPLGGAPSSSKRASFVPLTGSGAVRITSHRRISSVSDPSGVADESTDSATTSFADDGPGATAEVKKARRSSAFFVLSPPPTAGRSPNPDFSITSEPSAINEELEALRKERDAARAELQTTRQELNEAQEGREASEQCVAALRAFISEQGSGTPSGLLKLPPLPTDKNTEADVQQQTQTNRPSFSAGGWSFGKLFRQESVGTAATSSSTTSGSSSRMPSAAGSPALENPPATNTNITPTSVQANAQSPPLAATSGAAALSRKIGGFFSARTASISSIASGTSATSAVSSIHSASTPTAAVIPKPESMVRPPTAHGQQEPSLNGMGSDEEDEDDGPLEPLSPTREHPVASVVVRAASTSASSVADGAAEEREIEVAAVTKLARPVSGVVEGESPSIL